MLNVVKLMSFNTFIIISCETLQKRQNGVLIKICGCLYITASFASSSGL